MEREVRYCSAADGAQIAYSIEGRGPTLVVCPYFLESFARDDDASPPWSALFRQLSVGRQLVRYDMRGTGLSQREGVEISHAGNVRDLDAVNQSGWS